MEMVVYFFCDSFADTAHPLDLREPGPRDGSRRAEMVQQRVFALGPDSRDFVERRVSDGLCPLGTMRADYKTMRLIAQPLQKIQHWIARFQ